MFIGNMHFRLDDVRLTGHHTRVFVAALQVMIVSALVCVHTIFMFFIRIVKQERTAFVLVSHHKATQGGQAEGERAVCVDETGTPAGSEREMCDASSVRVDAESETLSVSDGGMSIVLRAGSMAKESRTRWLFRRPGKKVTSNLAWVATTAVPKPLPPSGKTYTR
jgi:hypothetical protein